MAAFKATLQETRQATLLLHVIDAADVRVQENIEAVNTVLEEIDAHEIPTLLVMNKIDMLDDFEPRIDRDEENKPDPCLAFCADRSGDTTAFSGFDGASFRRGGAAYIASAAAGRASEKSFLSASGNRKRVDGGGRQRKSASSYAGSLTGVASVNKNRRCRLPDLTA